MAYTTKDDGSAYFQTKLYTRTDSSNSVTNDGNSDLQPDFIWIKERDGTGQHGAFDSSRGVQKELKIDEDGAESTASQSVTAFNSDGFTVGTAGDYNGSDNLQVAWQWKANSGTATATGSESGDNPAYSAQANQTAGFSIITYTGTGAEGDVTHGLGGKPDWIITKVRNGNGDEPWPVWHKDMVDADADNGAYAYLNTTGQDQTTSVFYEGDAISSTVVAFKGGNANVNADGTNYVMYCFRGIQGYSKFGSYKGNGNTDGPFIYTGFQPAWIMIKRTDNTGSWLIFDNKRNGKNPDNDELEANTTSEEVSNDRLDILSNGFKIRNSAGYVNASSAIYVYMAFAELPFVSSKGVPVTAR